MFFIDNRKKHQKFFIADDGRVFALIYDEDVDAEYHYYLVNLDELELYVMFENLPDTSEIEEEIGPHEAIPTARFALHLIE
ncbi:hypothetical protein [Radiobacillus sp. PE A8.2]|uniref:hypothetical protein n=1 Tax=Radiobacillus sp. PE A8.2 TaxID=3380349 RepID=UPI00388D2B5F